MKKEVQILNYAYERKDEEIVQTYVVTKENENILLIPLQKFYFSILGEKTIEKLTCRGYLSLEEVKEKYTDFKIKENIKIKKRH